MSISQVKPYGPFLQGLSMLAATLIAWGVMQSNVSHLTAERDLQRAAFIKMEERQNKLEIESARTNAALVAILNSLAEIKMDIREASKSSKSTAAN